MNDTQQPRSAVIFGARNLGRGVIERRVPVGDDASFVDAPRPRGLDQ